MQPVLQWESNNYYIFWVCVCSLRYLASNAHASYCHLWPVWLYHNFFTLSHKRYNKVLSIKRNCVLIFSTTFVWNYERDMMKNVHWSSCEVHILLSCLNETWIFSTDFSKQKKSNFTENPSSGTGLLHVNVQTDKHDEANSSFSQFCERTWKRLTTYKLKTKYYSAQIKLWAHPSGCAV